MSYKCNYNERYDYIKKALEKERKLIVKNADKITLAEVRKTSSLMDLDSKYI